MIIELQDKLLNLISNASFFTLEQKEEWNSYLEFLDEKHLGDLIEIIENGSQELNTIKDKQIVLDKTYHQKLINYKRKKKLDLAKKIEIFSEKDKGDDQLNLLNQL